MLDLVKSKFLLADDDSDDADIFCEILTSIESSIECLTVGNGRDVFELLSKGDNYRPDVIFIDINMPIMNGWECLRTLKSDPGYNDIPTVIYSTSSAKTDIETAYNLGASFFLCKPEDLEELHQILEIVATAPQTVLLKRLAGFKSVKLVSN